MYCLQCNPVSVDCFATTRWSKPLNSQLLFLNSALFVNSLFPLGIINSLCTIFVLISHRYSFWRNVSPMTQFFFQVFYRTRFHLNRKLCKIDSYLYLLVRSLLNLAIVQMGLLVFVVIFHEIYTMIYLTISIRTIQFHKNFSNKL